MKREVIKSIRFTAAEMLEIMLKAKAEKRSVSDMVRLLSLEAIVEREKDILNKLIAEFGLKHEKVIKQDKRVNELLNNL